MHATSVEERLNALEQRSKQEVKIDSADSFSAGPLGVLLEQMQAMTKMQQQTNAALDRLTKQLTQQTADISKVSGTVDILVDDTRDIRSQFVVLSKFVCDFSAAARAQNPAVPEFPISLPAAHPVPASVAASVSQTQAQRFSQQSAQRVASSSPQSLSVAATSASMPVPVSITGVSDGEKSPKASAVSASKQSDSPVKAQLPKRQKFDGNRYEALAAEDDTGKMVDGDKSETDPDEVTAGKRTRYQLSAKKVTPTASVSVSAFAGSASGSVVAAESPSAVVSVASPNPATPAAPTSSASSSVSAVPGPVSFPLPAGPAAAATQQAQSKADPKKEEAKSTEKTQTGGKWRGKGRSSQ
jgi:hypothetical protein